MCVCACVHCCSHHSGLICDDTKGCGIDNASRTKNVATSNNFLSSTSLHVLSILLQVAVVFSSTAVSIAFFFAFRFLFHLVAHAFRSSRSNFYSLFIHFSLSKRCLLSRTLEFMHRQTQQVSRVCSPRARLRAQCRPLCQHEQRAQLDVAAAGRR